MIKIGKIYAISWRVVLGASVVLAILWSFYGFRLRTLTPGVSQAEQAIVQQKHSIGMIVENPVLAPYKGTQMVAEKFKKRTVAHNRYISALTAALAIVAFFILLRNFSTLRMALLGTALFASSSFTLHIARSGTPDVLYLGFVVLLAAVAQLQFSAKQQKTTFLAACLTCAGLLYVPGMVLLLLPMAVWQRKRIVALFQEQAMWFSLTTIGVVAVLLLPLAWGIVSNAEVIKTLVLWPQDFPSLAHAARQAIIPLEQLFVQHDSVAADMWLGSTAILDAITAVFVLLGVYVVAAKKRLDRFWLAAGVILITVMSSALGARQLLEIFIVVVYILATLGMALLLQQWQTVFPKNPFAKWIGLVITCALVALAAGYQLNRYFVAWPHAPATKKAMLQVRP
jgi:hypothetical protein